MHPRPKQEHGIQGLRRYGTLASNVANENSPSPDLLYASIRLDSRPSLIHVSLRFFAWPLVVALARLAPVFLCMFRTTRQSRDLMAPPTPVYRYAKIIRSGIHLSLPLRCPTRRTSLPTFVQRLTSWSPQLVSEVQIRPSYLRFDALSALRHEMVAHLPRLPMPRTRP